MTPLAACRLALVVIALSVGVAYLHSSMRHVDYGQCDLIQPYERC